MCDAQLLCQCQVLYIYLVDIACLVLVINMYSHKRLVPEILAILTSSARVLLLNVYVKLCIPAYAYAYLHI